MESKDCNVKIDGKNVFNLLVENNLKIYDSIWKIKTGQGDDSTTGTDGTINLLSNDWWF